MLGERQWQRNPRGVTRQSVRQGGIRSAEQGEYRARSGNRQIIYGGGRWHGQCREPGRDWHHFPTNIAGLGILPARPESNRVYASKTVLPPVTVRTTSMSLIFSGDTVCGSFASTT